MGKFRACDAVEACHYVRGVPCFGLHLLHSTDMADAGTAAESAAPALHHTLSLDSTSVLSLAVDQELSLIHI